MPESKSGWQPWPLELKNLSLPNTRVFWILLQQASLSRSHEGLITLGTDPRTPSGQPQHLLDFQGAHDPGAACWDSQAPVRAPCGHRDQSESFKTPGVCGDAGRWPLRCGGNGRATGAEDPSRDLCAAGRASLHLHLCFRAPAVSAPGACNESSVEAYAA